MGKGALLTVTAATAGDVTNYGDLRGWLEAAEGLGEVKQVRGADCHLEVGGICALASPRESYPALLFDQLQGYPAGYRLLVNPLGSFNRFALTARLPLGRTKREYADLWRRRLKEISLVKPVYVAQGPVMENVHIGGEVNLLEFPTPFWHEGDGGRYIGTANMFITADPETGWVNFGTYRTMILDEKRLVTYISPGKHGSIHRQEHFSRGEPCPVAISFGHDPLFFLVASLEIPAGVSEYDFAGGMAGSPIEVMKGPLTGLPIPARAEVVIEGECVASNQEKEGPFGEWAGYYGSSSRAEPVIEVKAIYHRQDPILLGNFHEKGVTAPTFHQSLSRAGLVWDELEKAGVPDVKGVWFLEAGGPRLLLAISIMQRYPGHARQAAHVASFCHAGAFYGRYVIVVDEDIDVSDLNQVMWAVCTRSDPQKSMEIFSRCWSSFADPIIPQGRKGFNSRAIIDACRPYEWRDEFPAVAAVSEELKAATRRKWRLT